MCVGGGGGERHSSLEFHFYGKHLYLLPPFQVFGENKSFVGGATAEVLRHIIDCKPGFPR